MHRSQAIQLDSAQLLVLYQRLATHHSGDPKQYKTWKKLQGAMAKLDPWRCKPCMMVNRGRDAECPWCWGHWTVVADETFQPPKHPQKPKAEAGNPTGTWTWSWPTAIAEKSDGKQPRKRSQSAKQRKKQQQQRAEEERSATKGNPFKGGKGGFGSEKSSASSPFAQAYSSPSPATAPQSPWISEEKPVTEEPLQEQMALASAVRKLFPDLSKAPPDIQVQVAKAEKAAKAAKPKPAPSNLAEKILEATASMKEAEEALNELRGARDAHKQEWRQHLIDSNRMWQEHLASYRQQQTQYQELIATAKAKFTTASNTIQRLNGGGGNVEVQATQIDAITSDNEDAEVAKDEAQEEQLQESLNTFQRETRADDVISVEEESMSEGGSPRPKRSREA